MQTLGDVFQLPALVSMLAFRASKVVRGTCIPDLDGQGD